MSNLELLLDMDAFEMHRSTEIAAIQSSNMFRVAPIQFIGKVPEGKCYEDWMETFDTAASHASVLIEHFFGRGNTLRELDFFTPKPKSIASIGTRSKSAINQPKGKGRDKLNPLVPLDDPAKTPPFVRKITDRTVNKVLEGIKKTNSAALLKEHAKSAHLAAPPVWKNAIMTWHQNLNLFT